MRRAHPGEVRSLIVEQDGSTPLTGWVDPEFRALADAFAQNLSKRGELGAALCVSIDGRRVVDLAGGWTGLDRASKWRSNTLVNSFSVGKGILAIALAMDASSGTMDPDLPVGDHWPELMRHGVGRIDVRQISAHRAGLPAIRTRMDPADLYDWDAMCRALSDTTPWWEPGASHGYHVNTFGFLVGNILLRVHDAKPAQLLDSLRPVVADEMFFGVPESSLHRVADLVWEHATDEASSQPDTPKNNGDASMQELAYRNPPNFSGIGAVNTTPWRRGVHPSTSLHASARGVCAAYETLLDPARVSTSVLSDVAMTVSDGVDEVLGTRTRFGTGFQLPIPGRSFGPGPGSLGHYGAGGSLGFCDPDARLCFGYVTNTMGRGWQNERNQALVNALNECL